MLEQVRKEEKSFENSIKLHMQLRSACAHYKRQEEELKEKVKEAEEVKKQNNEKDAKIEKL